MDKKVIFFIIGCFIVIFLACAGTNKGTAQRTGAIQLTWNIPMLDGGTGKLGGAHDSCLIYYNDGLTLLRFPYEYKKFNSKVFSLNPKDTVDNPKSIEKSEIWFENFVYNKSDKHGLRYDSLQVKTGTLFNVDSLLKGRMFKEAKFLDTSNDLLVKTTKNSDGTILETYVPKTKPDASYNDTTYLLFDPRLKDVPYSLSRPVDSLKKMKLSEVRFVYNGIPKTATSPIEIPKRVFLFKISSLDIVNKKEVQGFFDRFKKEKHN